jgi:catechol 2,3-dioxygenase-like lactoylglutathione lyase family enzyme
MPAASAAGETNLDNPAPMLQNPASAIDFKEAFMAEMKSGWRPEEGKQESSPIHVKKIGHVVFSVSDIERTGKFWTEIMGFNFSDRNEKGMVFFRSGTDHHTVALLQAKDKNELPKRGDVGFDHVAFEVGSVSELFKIRDFLRAKGVEIFYEGRRGPGGNPGVEFYDPDGYQIEVYASMDQVGTDGRSRPGNEWKRATTLEEAVANPLPGAEYY